MNPPTLTSPVDDGVHVPALRDAREQPAKEAQPGSNPRRRRSPGAGLLAGVLGPPLGRETVARALATMDPDAPVTFVAEGDEVLHEWIAPVRLTASALSSRESPGHFRAARPPPRPGRAMEARPAGGPSPSPP